MLHRLEPMKSDPKRRNQKQYRQFYGEVGQNTNDYTYLKDEIKRHIHLGQLQEFKAYRRNQGQRNDNHHRDDNCREYDYEPVRVIQTIHRGPYIGGDSMPFQKNQTQEAKQVYQERFQNLSSTKPLKALKLDGMEIIFLEEDANCVYFLGNDVLVVEAMIGNHIVCRILVDDGSSVDILYTDFLTKWESQRSI